MNDSYASSDGFPALIRILSEASEWIVLSHVKPDGDALGSASAFASVGRKLGKTVVWGGPDEYPSRYLFLEGSGEFRPNLKLSSLALTEGSVVLALDTSTRARSVEDLDALPENVPLLNVDHHADNELFGTVNYVDPSSSSTGEIAWLLLREWGIPLEIDVLEAVYTALATDCGNFRFRVLRRGPTGLQRNFLTEGFLRQSWMSESGAMHPFP
ncbi:MAG TPA: DHH family phosphoesterase, partial [Synergistales bacterium]|nr:DHH family phosphoesterase [Synergistales bacterium]